MVPWKSRPFDITLSILLELYLRPRIARTEFHNILHSSLLRLFINQNYHNGNTAGVIVFDKSFCGLRTRSSVCSPFKISCLNQIWSGHHIASINRLYQISYALLKRAKKKTSFFCDAVCFGMI